MFAKRSTLDGWQRYALSSEYTRTLNIRMFWMYQDSEYTSGSEYGRFCVTHTRFWICLNMPKSVWKVFVLHFAIVIPCLLEHVVTYFNVYTKLKGTWRNMRLFSQGDKIFSIVAGSIWFIFCFRLNIFTSFKICCCLWRPGRWGDRCVSLDIP